MGNSFGCSATGERLVSAARDGDLVEAMMLLHFNPCLARYSTFGGLNCPLHFAAAKGHNEIVSLLLEHGADVDARNYCGQTAVMHACRYGYWEVVQTLMLHRCNVTRADYLSGRTALHYAAVNGHVRCIRLVVADFVPSMPYDTIVSTLDGERGDSYGRQKYDHAALSKFVNKAADGGITALHMAALNGYFQCVQFLLDIHATVSAVTFCYGTSMDLIGAGSTPLHYAACGGNLKCCQVLLARGASRLTLNCNGWLPYDVARIWGRDWIEPWLAPNSDFGLPTFAPSKFLSLPLLSVLDIARGYGLQYTASSNDNTDTCAVCLERSCSVAAEGCLHELCTICALHICSISNVTSETAEPPGSIPCPLCRQGIVSFVKLGGSPAKEFKLTRPLSCTSCMLHAGYPETRLPVRPRPTHMPKNQIASTCPEGLCPVSCTPFSLLSVPSCTCNDDPCQSLESHSDDRRDRPSLPRGSGDTSQGQECKLNDPLEKIRCSIMFWGRRSWQHMHRLTTMEVRLCRPWMIDHFYSLVIFRFSEVMQLELELVHSNSNYRLRHWHPLNFGF